MKANSCFLFSTRGYIHTFEGLRTQMFSTCALVNRVAARELRDEGAEGGE